MSWASLRERPDITSAVFDAGRRYVGRVAELERDEAAFEPLTLIHGDVSSRNLRSSGMGEIALVDWEGRTAGKRRNRPDLALGLIRGTSTVGRSVGSVRFRRSRDRMRASPRVGPGDPDVLRVRAGIHGRNGVDGATRGGRAADALASRSHSAPACTHKHRRRGHGSRLRFPASIAPTSGGSSSR